MCQKQVRLIYSLKFDACVVQVEATMTSTSTWGLHLEFRRELMA